MKTPARPGLLLAICGAVGLCLCGCNDSPSGPTSLVLAPPGPADLGPATDLGTPPPGAAVFELAYRPQRGANDEPQYHSFWGYGGGEDEAKQDPFLQDVRKKGSRIHPVKSPFKGREWAAVEYGSQKAFALYFDLDADGRLSDNERIQPSRKEHQEVQFITPDFMNRQPDGTECLCRVLVQVNFWNSQPNCMWSPASLLEGTAELNGQRARLLLLTSRPDGRFDEYGSSSYSLTLGGADAGPGNYIPRERLSSVISSRNEFYHLKLDGRRTNGLPARAVLWKSTAPVGELAVKLAGSNTLSSAPLSLYLNGIEDKTVFFHVSGTKDKVRLPAGGYDIDSGMISYGASEKQDWTVSFRRAPRAAIRKGETFELALGQPALSVRAIDEKTRYQSEPTVAATFKKGTRIYLEPRIAGAAQEVFTRFSQSSGNNQDRADRPPQVKITGPDGKEVLSKTMEYG